jgi:hypothetical protein
VRVSLAEILVLLAAGLLAAGEIYRRWWWWHRVREVKRRPLLSLSVDEIERDWDEQARRSWTHRWVHRGSR